MGGWSNSVIKNGYFSSDTPMGGWTSILPDPYFYFVLLIPQTHPHTHRVCVCVCLSWPIFLSTHQHHTPWNIWYHGQLYEHSSYVHVTVLNTVWLWRYFEEGCYSWNGHMYMSTHSQSGSCSAKIHMYTCYWYCCAFKMYSTTTFGYLITGSLPIQDI